MAMRYSIQKTALSNSLPIPFQKSQKHSFCLATISNGFETTKLLESWEDKHEVSWMKKNHRPVFCFVFKRALVDLERSWTASSSLFFQQPLSTKGTHLCINSK